MLSISILKFPKMAGAQVFENTCQDFISVDLQNYSFIKCVHVVLSVLKYFSNK